MERVPLERKVLNENDRLAAALRARFAASGVLCVNLVSSPGAGKTALLERTLDRLDRSLRAAVVTGDIQTDNDAARLMRFGFPVRQITTGGTCHLDARMVDRSLIGWRLDRLDILFIENVGNLVCPASYDLGEAAKVVVLSVTEGQDKPLKYPGMFFRAGLMLLNKIDLLPHVPFDADAAEDNARRVHPGLASIRVSALTGAGLPAWLAWLDDMRRHRPLPAAVPAL